MLDKSLKLSYLIMTKNDLDNYPIYNLPNGYSFVMYEDGNDVDWVNIEIAVDQFESLSEGLEQFNIQFDESRDKVSRKNRILFVKNPQGKLVATGAIWPGDFNGKIVDRMHWIAVDESCKGLGIAKAIVTELLNLYHRLNLTYPLYLITESWCYSAINIYSKFGFIPFKEHYCPTEELGMSDEVFDKQNIEGWKAVEDKINSYKK